VESEIEYYVDKILRGGTMLPINNGWLINPEVRILHKKSASYLIGGDRGRNNSKLILLEKIIKSLL